MKITFTGFRDDVAHRYAASDLLIHTCPTEPFGLVILEAMAARIPVLVPDSGGAASLVEDGVTGFIFRANDPAHLAQRLEELRNADPAVLNRVVENSAIQLQKRFSVDAARVRYRRLFAPTAQTRRYAAAQWRLRQWLSATVSTARSLIF